MRTCSGSNSGLLDDEALYTELLTHGTDYDGLFFVGVSSTGIYCRTVCTAHTPKRENCSFFPTAAAAEAAGYRPCLKCRPELAPDTPYPYEKRNIAHHAAELIRRTPAPCNIAGIANELGLSDRQLRRVFEDEYGVSPAVYRNTCRLLLAKSLLTDTDLPVTQVAYSCGFSSIRRFNDAFSRQYRMSPSRLRKPLAASKARLHPIELRFDYRPPYRFDLLLEFLGYRAIEGVEVVADGAYWRTVKAESGTGLRSEVGSELSSGLRQDRGSELSPGLRQDMRSELKLEPGSDSFQTADADVTSFSQPSVGWIRVRDFPQKHCLKVTISPELFGELPLVISKVRRLFDIDCIPQAVQAGLADFYERVPRSYIPGIRVPCSFDGFEMAVRAILGQQITVRAANTLAGRVSRAFGTPVCLSEEECAAAPLSGLTTAFPSPLAFCTPDAAERLGVLGVVRQRAKAICSLAEALCSGELDLRPGADIDKAATRLLAISGIGEWTVHYMLMRAFDYPDAFLASDFGVKSAFPDMKEKALKELSEKWSPFRSYAVMSLWSTPHE